MNSLHSEPFICERFILATAGRPSHASSATISKIIFLFCKIIFTISKMIFTISKMIFPFL